MITTTPGVGSIYLSTYRDKAGDWLDGAKSYRLRVAPNPPMKQFWAVSVYDMDTRNLFRNESLKAEVSSKAAVQTQKGIFWFSYFRLYAPTEAYFDKSWPLPDIEEVK